MTQHTQHSDMPELRIIISRKLIPNLKKEVWDLLNEVFTAVKKGVT